MKSGDRWLRRQPDGVRDSFADSCSHGYSNKRVDFKGIVKNLILKTDLKKIIPISTSKSYKKMIMQ